jgi:1-acyl-sn-glycerol-3-phosphate acyltransferase
METFIFKRLNYAWRVVATGFCFTVFGVGGLLLTLTVFPLIYMLPVNTQWKREKAQWVIHNSFRLFVWFMQFVGVIRLTISGAERLRQGGNHLIIANHPTLIDVVILISLLPQVDCIVKQALWRNPFLRGVVRSAGYISNSNPQSLMKVCIATLQKGRSLIIFPEGTRTTPNKPMKFQRGAANIALRSKHDIIPVAITCVPSTLTKGKKWYEVPPDGRCHITIKVGNIIQTSQFIEQSLNISRASRKLTDFMYQYLQKQTLSRNKVD